MYRGGKICLTDHFKPLWARNVPKFGIAHAMALGVSSYLTKIISFGCFFIFVINVAIRKDMPNSRVLPTLFAYYSPWIDVEHFLD